MIRRQSRSYKKVDPPTKHQKAIPPEVYRQLLRTSTKQREKARATLLAGALFFCMRSCEYSKTPAHEQKTRTIRPCDIIFRAGARIIPHDHPLLHLAPSVTIIFGIQKSEVMDEPINQYRSGDPELCPVQHWANVVRRLRSYPNYNDKWPVYTYFDGTKFSDLSSKEFINDIRAIVDTIGRDILGFTSESVGTHSNRSGGAMMMYLAKNPPYTIMMIGRWSSNAFLKYIEKQVLEFSKGVSQKMLLYNTFYNIPLQKWTDSSSETSTRPARQYYMPALRQVFGGQQSSLRDQLFHSMAYSLS